MQRLKGDLGINQIYVFKYIKQFISDICRLAELYKSIAQNI